MSAPAQPPTEGAEGTAPGGGPPGPPPNTTSNRRLQQTQAQVEEVVDIMRVNVDKVLKRDEILSQLDDRADALQVGASQFESSAAKLKRKYWWKNCKMMIMLGAICAIIVVVIVTHKQEEAEARPGRVWMLAFHAAACHCAKPSFLSLCPFPTFPSSCPRAGLKSWKKAVSVPSQRPPSKVSTLLWAPPCLMQGVTAGEEPPLSSMCPKPGANSHSWPT
ncbi:vesicle-associated membrane protein 1 isoform X1 [Neomonachus schauinslandi]|uniref:Vesicle-associated membrane protein 1 isoform X1 n=1 Tax=Neomonachus schauinslandi TaxID=29088 RepID=A0A2Y9HAD6_NEOSC|nr:vesicle-associated membrane protein 1 isoform X1 [Neomonachus schauinslandi]